MIEEMNIRFLFTTQVLASLNIKASANISPKHVRGLKALAEENVAKTSIVFCFEEKKRKLGDVWIYPWKLFLQELWNGQF
jgi:hypothetical protein